MLGGRLAGIALIAAAVVAAGAIAFVALFGGLVLVVEGAPSARVIHREPVRPGARFVLSYVHSSEHVPVRGTFRIEPDRSLTVVATAFAGFGPGLPALQPGDAWETHEGMFVQRDPGARLPELRLRVVPLTRHRLETPGGRHLDLSALMGAGGPVRIHVRPATVAERFQDWAAGARTDA
ncbi:MAG: DUF1850 domain-containing protein [Candidatus Rokuibacteriota bacterium]